MKYIKIISLSIIIFICCLYPVVSAEVNGTGNNTNLTDDNSIHLSDLNSHGKKYPMFKIEGNTTYHVGDSYRFHVTWNPEYRGPIHVNLDNCYETTVTSDTGQFYITINGVDLSPGLHFFSVESEPDDNTKIDGATLTLLIKE